MGMPPMKISEALGGLAAAATAIAIPATSGLPLEIGVPLGAVPVIGTVCAILLIRRSKREKSAVAAVPTRRVDEPVGGMEEFVANTLVLFATITIPDYDNLNRSNPVAISAGIATKESTLTTLELDCRRLIPSLRRAAREARKEVDFTNHGGIPVVKEYINSISDSLNYIVVEHKIVINLLDQTNHFDCEVCHILSETVHKRVIEANKIIEQILIRLGPEKAKKSDAKIYVEQSKQAAKNLNKAGNQLAILRKKLIAGKEKCKPLVKCLNQHDKESTQ